MKTVLKWIGIVAGALVGVIIVLLAFVFISTESRANATYTINPDLLSVSLADTSLAEGERLYVTRGCADCHGFDGGGTMLFDDPAIGTVFSSNLTAGANGVGANYTTEDYVRAIRHGVGPDGKPLLIMPSNEFYVFSDEHAANIVAYIQSLEPVDSEPVEQRFGVLGRVLTVAGMVNAWPAEIIEHDAARPAPVAVGATAEYGAYLSNNCIGCHGANLSGGAIPGDPSPAVPTNLTPDDATGLGTWTEEDFSEAMRGGIRPDGTTIDTAMPWPNFSQMTDTEIRALWLYLQTVPPLPEGNR